MSRDLSKFIDEWGFFTPIPEAIIDRMAKLGVDAFCLFSYLRFRTHRDRQVAYPSYEKMATDTGIRFERIAAAIKVLEAAGMLVRSKRFGGSTIYRLVPPPDLAASFGASASPPAGGGLEREKDAPVLRQAEAIPSTGGGQSSGRRRTVLRQAEGIQDSSTQDRSVLDLRTQDAGGLQPAAPQNLWVATLGQLQQQFRRGDFETWLRDTQVVSESDGELIVGTGNSHGLTWLQEHAREPAEAALEKIAGRPMSVRFVVLERAGVTG